ncbi:MAG: MBOAT family protein [Lentisphaeria bacterium]|jgi:D-alanyl-lipoteichoic acid acyltransferase DltB (MBOAT superfamily)
MLFSSHEFIFLFLPVVLAGYFLLSRSGRPWLPRGWLVAASLFFYGWFRPAYLPLIAGSILVNFGIGRWLGRSTAAAWRHGVLACGLALNVGLLGYYKYYDFAVANLNALTGLDWALRGLVLPLGISFFTFQQISYIVDCHRRESPAHYSLLNYSLFVLFFPQLIAGPIVLHHEMMPQFDRPAGAKPHGLNLAAGLHLFAVGLFKKVVLADTFAEAATRGFDLMPELSFWPAWLAALAYTLQIYFDFSGYCDMAGGIGRMFNIHLPVNFNSPYRARSIKEFWSRWHITLGRFLSHYLYIPLGGNRKGSWRTYLNLMLTFLVSGLWHGAGWTFVLWGALHGAAVTAQRAWNDRGFVMHRWAGRLLTFLFVVVAWVFFRARTMADAGKVLRGMFASRDFSWRPVELLKPESLNDADFLLWLAAGLAIVFLGKNAITRNHTFQPTRRNALATVALLVVSVLYMSRISPFIYYNF